MFESFKRAVKNWFMRAGADTGIAREFKDIFELGGDPAFQQFYNMGIYPWKCLYKGLYEPWHVIAAPTISDPRAKRNMAYLNLSKAVCCELAGMVWTDQTEVPVSTNGIELADDEIDPLEAFVAKTLEENNFGVAT